MMIDLTGKKFNKLTVLKRVENKGKALMWLCRCDCGNEKVIEGNNLKRGTTKSCGCLNNEKIKDITGQRFGRLVVTGYAGKSHYNCVCDCGNERMVLRQNLIKGRQISCGCYAKEVNKKLMTTHGLSESPLYRVWRGMISRCENPNVKCYGTYGGRGLSVCAEWKNDFKAFYDWAIENGWKQGLQIDRISNEDGYNPQNCRIVTQIENENNRRDNRIIEYKGKKYTVTQLANECGFSRHLLYDRIFMRGWSVDEAVSIEPKIGNNQKTRGNGETNESN